MRRLNSEGHKVASLTGAYEAGQRDMIIDAFRSGEAKVLIATNVLSRGIDVQTVSLVINYVSLPSHEHFILYSYSITGPTRRRPRQRRSPSLPPSYRAYRTLWPCRCLHKLDHRSTKLRYDTPNLGLLRRGNDGASQRRLGYCRSYHQESHQELTSRCWIQPACR